MDMVCPVITIAAACSFRSLKNGRSNRKYSRRFSVTVASKKDRRRSIGDQLLDYIEGGPKLRKWYGAPEQIRKDETDKIAGKTDEELDMEDDDVRDAILVTDADSMTGQLLLLALIVKRMRIRALVRNGKEIVQAFGSYVEPVVGDVSDRKILKVALKGVRAVLCPIKIGALADKEITKGVEHIVFLSQSVAYSNAGGLTGLLYLNARRQAEEDERTLNNLGIPCTIVRTAALQDEPGGQKGVVFKEGIAKGGTITREDVAMICAKALEYPPEQTIIFEVANAGDKVEDWDVLFDSLK